MAPAQREAMASYHPGGYGCYAEVERERERLESGSFVKDLTEGRYKTKQMEAD